MNGRRKGPDLVVASYRRSGTHLLLTYLEQQLGLHPRKSHDFAHELKPRGIPVLHIVRDPVEVLWSTYRWFVLGASENERIKSALDGLSFGAFLRGEGGPHVGYASIHDGARDSFHSDKGMLYQPIRYWADHTRSHLAADGGTLLVRYEQLVDQPVDVITAVATHLGVEMPADLTPITRDQLVGHSPSPRPQIPPIEQWTPDLLDLLEHETGGLVHQLGYARRPTSAANVHQIAMARRARRAGAVRYVARNDNTGYAVAGRRCIEALAAAGIDVVWAPQPTAPGEQPFPRHVTPDALSSRYHPERTCDLTIMHTMPDRWSRIRDRFDSDRFVGHTVWELEQLPRSWRGSLHAADRLWVPTEWNRQTFARHGVQRPIDVIPHVVTTDESDVPPVEIPDDVTVFSTVASWHPRKRPDLTVAAFATAFTRDDPVLLIVKTAPETDAWPADNDLQRATWWQLLQVIRQHPNAPEVMLVTDDFSDAEVNGLLERSDCYVSLAASEGWGLGVFDAATLGTPVITTGFGGQVTYLGADHPGLVPFTLGPIGDAENSPHFEHGMVWAHPDVAAAATMMRAVLDPVHPLRTGADELAQRLRRDYSPEAVGRRLCVALEQAL